MATNIDRLIARFLPAVGAAFLAGGAWYLIYSEIWPGVPYELRILMGAVLSFILVFFGSSGKISSKFFSDAVSAIGILVGYGTLIYASRTGSIQALLPEGASLLVAFLFSAAASFISVTKNSKTVLLSSVLGAYLTPFFIGQVDTWRYMLDYNAYLAYFLAVNVALFVASHKMNLADLVPINGVSLMTATVFLRVFGYSSGFSADSAIVTFFLLFAIVTVLVFAIFRSEWSHADATKNLSAFIWVAPALWFLGNAHSLSNAVSSEIRAIFEIILGLGFFGVWHLLRNAKKSASGAYISGTLLVTTGIIVLLSDSLSYVGIGMSAVGALLLFLGISGGRELERLFSGIGFAIVGVLITTFSTQELWNDGTMERLYVSFMVGISLSPLLALSFVRKDDFSEEWKTFAEFASSCSWIALGLIGFLNVVSINLNPLILFFFLPTFLAASAIVVLPIVPENGRRILQGVGYWAAIGGFFAFFKILPAIFDSPYSVSFHTTVAAYAFLGGTTYAILLASSKKFETKFPILEKFFGLYLFFSVHFFIIATLNALIGTGGSDGIRAVATTLYWVTVAVIILWNGLETRNGKMKRLGFSALAFTIIKVIFYDLGSSSSTMKVTVLMVVGMALLAFSWYAMKRGILLEDAAEETSSKEVPEETVPAVNKEVSEETVPAVNRNIANLDLGNIVSATVTPLGSPAFRVNSKNLLKIMKLVVTQFGKSREVYLPGELLPVYEIIIKGYKSELPKATYDSVAATMKDFCKRGGSVSFK